MPHQCTNCGRRFGDGSKEMLAGCPDCGGNKFQFHPAGTEPAPAEPPSRPDPSDLPGGAATATAVEHGSKAARAVERASTTLKDFVGRSSSTTASTASTPVSATESDPGGSGAAAPTDEDFAQSSARSEMVHRDELPATEQQDGEADRSSDPDDESTRPDLRPSGPWPGQDDETHPSEQPGAADQAGTADQPAAPSGGQPEATMEDAPESSNTDTAPGGAVQQHAEPEPDDATPEQMSLKELRAELDDQFESIKILEPGQYEINLMELYERDEYIISLQEDGRYVIEMASTFRD